MGCPDQCNCVKCRQERTAISRTATDDTEADDGHGSPGSRGQSRASARDDADDADRDRAFGGRLVAVENPRKTDPADAEPTPSAGRLSKDQVAELNDAFERVADDIGPDPDVLAERRRELERRRREGSKVDLTERDIEEARMSTQEQLLEAIEELTDTADTGATLRKQDGDDADDGAHGLREQDLADAVADLLNVPVADVLDRFDALRDGDDGDDTGRDELADAVADHLGVPRDDAAALLDELAARDDGDDDTGTDAGDAGDDTARSKATVRKSVPAVSIGSDAHGRAAIVPADGNPVPLDALTGR